MFINIEMERMRKQLSKAELAAYLQVSIRTLRAWVAGERGIPAAKLRFMACLFDCSADYLLHTFL